MRSQAEDGSGDNKAMYLLSSQMKAMGEAGGR